MRVSAPSPPVFPAKLSKMGIAGKFTRNKARSRSQRQLDLPEIPA